MFINIECQPKAIVSSLDLFAVKENFVTIWPQWNTLLFNVAEYQPLKAFRDNGGKNHRTMFF